jgi:predicted O-linked N-acetylglucosamine transferase (SPINDLY family)
MSSEALAERIRADGIDILVDISGHTAGNCLQVFARKPAPVSLHWLDFGYTTGLTAIDYYLTDQFTIPEGSEHLFSEKPWRMPGTAYAYRPAEGMGEVSALPAKARGYITFGTLTRAVRINHHVIRTWSAILKQTPNARLVINSGNYQNPVLRQQLLDRFAEQGIAADRLDIGSNSPPWDVLRGIDIGLDCFPHNSGTTLFETLYMGIPFITGSQRTAWFGTS